MYKHFILIFFTILPICCFALYFALISQKFKKLRGSYRFFGPFLGIIFFVFTFFVFTEVRPWFDEFYKTVGQINWFPLFSSADPVPYLKCSIKTNPTFAYLYSIFGPCVFLRIFRPNYSLIYLFFVSSFVLLSYLLIRLRGLRGWYFISLLLLTPWVIIQFTLPNKEIFIILSMMNFLIYRKKKDKFTYSLSILFAAFSRIEYIILYLMFLALRKFSLKMRYYFIGALITGISVFYKYIPGMSDKSEDLFKYQGDAPFGFTAFLNRLCEDFYLFVLVIIPRIFLNIFEKTKGYIFSGNEVGDNISFVIDVSSEWIFFTALIIAVYKRKVFRLEDDRSLLFWLFVISVVTVPFPIFRYILPAYVLLISFVLDDVEEIKEVNG